MHVNHRISLALLSSVIFLTSCGEVQFVESPESWGRQGGEYGSSEWVKINGTSNYPSSDSVAAYCVIVGEDGEKKYGWSIQQAMASTDACVTAFVAGLSK